MSFNDIENLRRKPSTTDAAAPGAKEKEENIRIDGFGQVIAMLQVADASFRESLLRRLAQKDPELALKIKRQLSGR